MFKEIFVCGEKEFDLFYCEDQDYDLFYDNKEFVESSEDMMFRKLRQVEFNKIVFPKNAIKLSKEELKDVLNNQGWKVDEYLARIEEKHLKGSLTSPQQVLWLLTIIPKLKLMESE